MKKERIIGIDNLRFIMVLFVIALHAAMTYMDYVPDWWYVINPQKSIGFTYLVIILDSFPMTVLFFLSGYFAPFSLARRGASSFLHNKFMHIGLPWILGVILVAPFFSRATMEALGFPVQSIIPFFFHDFFCPFYQQAHYWFLGVLFLFFLIYATVYKIKFSTKASPLSLIIAIVVLTALTYFLSSRYYKPTDGWTNIAYILYFQPARFIGYLSMFFLGIHAQKSNWFKENGWKPSLGIFFPLSLLSLLGLVSVKMNLFFQYTELQKQWVDALFYSLTSVLITFFLISVFMKLSSSIQKTLSFFPPYSYGIYWLHQLILMPVMYNLINFSIPIFFKWLVAVLLTLVITTILTRYVLKKAPVLKKMF